MKSVGIDIGSHSIKVAIIESDSKSFKLTQFQHYPFTQSKNTDKTIETIDRLRNLFQNLDPKNIKFIVNVSQDLLSVKSKFFPFSDRKKILKSLPFDLEDELPLSPSNTIYDYKVRYGVNKGVETLAVACPKEHIKKILRMCHDSGFEPHIISTDGLALANIFERWHETPIIIKTDEINEDQENEAVIVEPAANAQAVIHFGHHKTLINIFTDKGLVTTRCLLWGIENVAHSLADRFKTSYFEVISNFKEHAFLDIKDKKNAPEKAIISDTLKAETLKFIDQLELYYIEINTKYNIKIDSAQIFGGICAIKNFTEFFSQNTSTKIIPISHLKMYKNCSIQKNMDSEHLSPVAIGLAIEGLRKSINPAINLRKEEFSKKNKNFQKIWQDWGQIIPLCIGIFFIFFTFSIIRNSITSSMSENSYSLLKSKATKLANRSRADSSPNKVLKYIKEQNKYQLGLKALEDLNYVESSMNIFDRVSEVLPKNHIKSRGKRNPLYEITAIDISTNKVRIEGKAINKTIISEIKNGIQSLATDGKANQVKSRTKTDKVFRSSFGFEVKL